jgi:hypothetical protein
MEEEDPVSDCAAWADDERLDRLQGRLAPERARDFDAHLPVCPACSARLAELQPLAALAGPERVEPRPATDAAVLAVIRAEAARRLPELAPKPETSRVRKSTSRILKIRRPAERASLGLRVFIGLAAAALFVAGLVYAVRPGVKPPPRIAARPMPVEPAPAPLPEPERPEAPPPPAPLVPAPPLPPPPPKLPAPPPPPPAPPAPAPVPAPPKRDTVVEAPPAPVEFARVLRVTGRTEPALRPGDAVFASQPVSCRLGVLLLETADRSLVALKAGTALVPSLAPGAVTLRLDEGEVACSVAKRPDRVFAVETPHGRSTVKGTVFGVRIFGSTSTLVVARGAVEARSGGAAAEVAAGWKSVMAPGAAPSKPEVLNADRALSWAFDAGLRVVGPIYLLAGSGELQAPMTRGPLYAEGSLSGAPVFAAVDSRTLPGWNGRFLPPERAEGMLTLTVDLPEDGTWYLWGRFYYPASGAQLFQQGGPLKDNDPNSFYAGVDGARPLVFGNHKQDPDTRQSGYRRWHWAGDGAVEIGRPAPLVLGTLTKGRHVIRIRNRDAVETGSLRLAPRLDAVCLVRDADYRPRDDDFRK